jgi:hypothetical protein
MGRLARISKNLLRGGLCFRIGSLALLVVFLAVLLGLRCLGGLGGRVVRRSLRRGRSLRKQRTSNHQRSNNQFIHSHSPLGVLEGFIDHLHNTIMLLIAAPGDSPGRLPGDTMLDHIRGGILNEPPFRFPNARSGLKDS